MWFKIAFVHDWLIYPWWAEKVFFEIIKDVLNWNWYYCKLIKDFSFKNPECKIFTTFFKKDFNLPVNLPVESVIKWKKVDKFSRQLFPVYPILQKILSYKINKFNPDLVIISSFAIAKNINVNAPCVLYLHSPMQYIWSHYEEYLNNPYFKNSKLKKLIFMLSSKYLRKWDKRYTNFSKIFFNSYYTKSCFEKFYNIKANWEVLYPNVVIPEYKKIDVFKKYNLPAKYYIYIWRTVRFVKKLDKIINYFNKTWENLVVVWDGPDFDFLKSLAKSNIKFLWYIWEESDDYWNLLENALALVNFTKESFGIVNYNAILMWKPVICLPHWAIKEMNWKKIYLDSKLWE